MTVSIAKFAYLLGTRVGEAGNPGPDDNQRTSQFHKCVSVVVCNPTAIYNKLDDLFSIDSNCFCLAETSATATVQKSTTFEAQKNGFNSFWSKPVLARQICEFDKPSYRGESLGTCCLTNLPARQCPIDISDDLKESSRISHAIVRFGPIDALVITVYGVTGNSPGSKRANDYLLASAFDIMTTCRLPCLIAGDFNIRPDILPCWHLYQSMGFKDAFQFYEDKWGQQLPPTCNNKTRNDTIIMSPLFQTLVQDIQVLKNCHFDKHDPLKITFRLPFERPVVEKWFMPKSWKDLNVMPSLVQNHYERQALKHNLEKDIGESDLSFDTVIQRWSSICENAVSDAIRDQNQIDPMIQPLKGLPKKYRGRCVQRKRVKVPLSNPYTYANDGSYNPDCLAFNVRSKHKIKQVRRIQSFLSSMRNFFSQYTCAPNYNQFQQWKSEWLSIQNAVGYGKSWIAWIVTFEAIDYAPLTLPTCEWLHCALQLTRHDCEHTCQQESIIRQQQFHLKLAFDRTDNYMRNTYKLIKPKSLPPVMSVEHETASMATLRRSQKGCVVLQLEDPEVCFSKDRDLSFGASVCQLLQQDGQIIRVRHLSGEIPSRAYVKQQKFAMQPNEVSQAFEKYWSPFWNRDTQDDLNSDESWEDINQIIQKVDPLHTLDISLDDPKIWFRTIKKLKKNKAAGYDGWFADDLKLLPYQAVKDLCKLSQSLWNTGMSVDHMQARTILLAKIDKVRHMGHCRPITILGQIYRLISKVIADQILFWWSYFLPDQISGGLPGRGSRCLMIAHQSRLEKAMLEKIQKGGFVLDLIKAFNCIPRRPLMKMMYNLGVPTPVITFWFLSLANLSRLPQIGLNLGHHVYSTTGIPEGDSLSVCGMIALAVYYYGHIIHHLNQVVVSIYADNWGWLTESQNQNFQALQKTLEFVHAIRMNIDFDKSWAYAIGKDFKKSLENLVLLFPDGKTPIHVVDDAKELGVMVKYSKKVKLGPIREKIDLAQKQIYKTHWMPITIQAKVYLIKAIWQKIFYGVECQAIGDQHFAKLRRVVASAILGLHKQASSWIACHFLHPQLVDPQLYVIIELTCLIRQLSECHPDLALEIVETASRFVYDPPRQTWGPGTSLAFYLRKMDLCISSNGLITGHQMQSVNCLQNTCREIKQFMVLTWESTVQKQMEHRKGVGHNQFDRGLTLSVLKHFEDKDLRGLFLNITGGYQSGAVKSLCYEEQEEFCHFCRQVDTKTHRLLMCPHFANLRRQHSEAIDILQHTHPEWIWLPIAQKHQDLDFFKLIMLTKTEIKPQDVLTLCDTHNDTIAVFTDGACEMSCDQQARRAGFAIVVDKSQNECERVQFLEKYAKTGIIPDCFRVHTTAHNWGGQNPARAELLAVSHLLCSLEKYGGLDKNLKIYTDSTYVINIIQKIDHILTNPLHKTYRTQNMDLIDNIVRVWENAKHFIFKVKAHQEITVLDDINEAWKKLGNFVADEAAKSSLKKEIAEVKQISKRIYDHNRSQKSKLKKVYEYMIAYNKKSQVDMQLYARTNEDPAQASGKVTEQNHPKKMNLEQILAEWKIKDPIQIPFPELTAELSKLCSWGMEAAHDVYEWLKTLSWPTSQEERFADHGITFLELYINFLLVTGKSVPVTIKRVGSVIHWAHVNSPQAIIQPQRTKAAITQAVVLDNIIQQLTKIMGIELIPIKKKLGIKSLCHLGHSSMHKKTGYMRRPQILYSAETIQVVNAYLCHCRDMKNFNLPMKVEKYIPKVPSPIHMHSHFSFEVYKPEQVKYFKKLAKKKNF